MKDDLDKVLEIYDTGPMDTDQVNRILEKSKAPLEVMRELAKRFEFYGPPDTSDCQTERPEE